MNENTCHFCGEFSETKISLASIPLDGRRRYIDDVCRVLNESRFGLGRTWHCLVDLSQGEKAAFSPATRFSRLECTRTEIWPLDIQRLMPERRQPACVCRHVKFQGLSRDLDHQPFDQRTASSCEPRAVSHLPHAPPAYVRVSQRRRLAILFLKPISRSLKIR